MVIKALEMRHKGPGSNTCLATTISDIGYIMLLSRNMIEILVKGREHNRHVVKGI